MRAGGQLEGSELAEAPQNAGWGYKGGSVLVRTAGVLIAPVIQTSEQNVVEMRGMPTPCVFFNHEANP